MLREGSTKRPQKSSARLALASLSALLLCGACATADLRAKPDFGAKALAGGDPFLASAALSAEYVPDIYAASYLTTRTAEEYLRQERPDLAKEMLRRAEALSRLPGAAANRYQLQTELARLYWLLDDKARAKQMLRDALDQSLALTDEAQRGQALEAIIEQAFQSPDYFSDLLQSAVDYVYVLQDPYLRVQRLASLGKKYQSLNQQNRSESLNQQAIAAAGSINNPWARARAWALIAKRYADTQDKESAERYIALALAAIDSVQVLAISNEDSEILLDVVVSLADAGHLREAGASAGALPSASMRAAALLAVIERSIRQKAELQTRLFVQRLLNTVGQADPAASADLNLSSLVRLAEIYAEAGRTDDSLRYVQACYPLFATAAAANLPAYRARLAAVQAQDGAVDDAIATADLITDNWIASQTMRQLAEFVAKRPDLPVKNRSLTLRTLLVYAEQMADQSSYLRDSAVADVASTAFRLGDDARGFRILDEVGNSYLAGKIYLDAAAVRPAGAAIKPETAKRLEQLQARQSAKAPPRR